MASAHGRAQADKGLVGHWSFNEGQGQEVRDSSGRNHHGRIKGGAKWIEGRQGAALEFNGADAMVEIAGAEGLNLAGDVTFMAWVRATADDGRDRLLFGDGAGLAVHRNISIGLDRGALFVGHGNGAQYESFTPSLKFDGTWKHLAVIFEQPKCYLYVDGLLHEVWELAMPVSRTQGGGRYIGGWWAGYFRGAIDEMRLYHRALTEREIMTHALAPAASADRAARISLVPRFKRGELGFGALFTRLAAKDATAQCTLTRKCEAKVQRAFSVPLRATRPDSERAVAEVAIPREELRSGTYVLAVTARDGQGKTLASIEKEVAIPDPPAWLGSRAGITDAVLPPFTPVEVKSDAGGVVLDVWGRSYRLAAHPLPDQIVSREAPLLSGPARLRAVVDGREISWSQAAPRVRQRSPAHAEVEQTASADGLTLRCLSRVEYDGFLRTDCTLAGEKPAEIQSLTLEIAFRQDRARYCYTWPTSFGSGGYSGQLARPMEFSFHPIVWIGDETRGLAWMCESENGFLPADPAKVLQVIPGGDQAIFRVQIIGKPMTLRPGRPLTYSFAFQATPLKPMGKDGWELRFTGCPWYGYDYDLLKEREFLGKPGLVGLKELGVRTLIATNWTPALTYPWPLERAADFKALVTACHAQGVRVIPYLGYQISEKAPEYPCVREEVLTFPPSTNPDKYPGMEPQIVSSVCLRSIWQDALADYVGRMMAEFDIDGVYLDSTNMPFPCMNALHGCQARRADGTAVPVYPVFAVRDAFRRIYAVVKSWKPDGIVDSHVYDCMNSAALAFSTTYWNGEQLSSADAPTDALPLDRFRTEFLGVNWGVPCELLAYRMGGFKKALAVSLPHDVLTRAWQEDLPLSAAIWKLAENFGRPEARFTPYYDPECPVRGLPKDWIASAYRHPTRGALVIVSNLSRQEGRARWKPDWKALGLDGPGPVVDGLTRQPLSLKDGDLEIALPAGAFKYLWLQRAVGPG